MRQKIAIVMFVALAASGCSGGGRTKATTAPVLQQFAEAVVTEPFTVGPRTFTPYKVAVTDGMLRPRLDGRFSASGARNDIEVAVLEEIDFLNWQNRNGFKAAYDSGRVTAGRIQVELPQQPGTYFMVFSNRFSIFSSKTVEADVKLLYDRVVTAAAQRD